MKLFISTLPLLAILSACNAPAPESASAASTAPAGPIAPMPPSAGPPAGAPARNFSTDVLVFTGDGTWATEITDAEALLTSHGASYQEATSAQLDAMGPSDLAKFGVIYIPGGEGSTEAQGVSVATHANLREAVQSLGVSYVGFCAGAFVAVAPAPPPGGDVSYGFGIVNGPVLDGYAGPGTDADYEMTNQTFADGSTEEILWYGGPITPNIGVIAKYPTGDPSISEMWSGNGLVLIAGLHPDLSTNTLEGLGASPVVSSQDTAWKIFNAALTGQPLPTF